MCFFNRHKTRAFRNVHKSGKMNMKYYIEAELQLEKDYTATVVSRSETVLFIPCGASGHS